MRCCPIFAYNGIMRSKPEQNLVMQVAKYLQERHPDVPYRFDLIADFPMRPFQAKRVKDIHGTRGYPDLFIARPVGQYAGLFLELKADGVSVFKKDGTLRKDDHLMEQAKYMKRLINEGYKANFAIGFDDTIKQIEDYLNGET